MYMGGWGAWGHGCMGVWGSGGQGAWRPGGQISNANMRTWVLKGVSHISNLLKIQRWISIILEIWVDLKSNFHQIGNSI